jgi:hypothetical protein
MANNLSPLSTTLGNVTAGLSGQVLSVPVNTGPVWSNSNYTLGNVLTAGSATASINANGTIKCKDLEIDDFSMKDILRQISTQVGLFIPPNTETLNVPAVQMAYTEYRNAREAFMKAKENLDLMVDLCRQSSKED